MSPKDPVGSLTPARSERLSLDGLALTRRVRDDADPRMPIIVLVHGAMDRAASFARVMRRLEEFEVVAYDRRGYADSLDAPRTSGSIDAHASDLLRVIEFCSSNRVAPSSGSPSAVVVVGHSLGGLVALRAAYRQSRSLMGLGAFESPAPWLDGSFDRVGGGAVELARLDGNAAGAEFFYRLMIGDDTFKRLRVKDRDLRRREGDALLAELESLRDPTQAFDLDAIASPVVIGTGEVSSPAMKQNSEQLANAIPHSVRAAVRGAGHGAHLTKPEGFAGYVRICVQRALNKMEGTSTDD